VENRQNDRMPSVLCYGDSNTWGYIASSEGRFGRGERWPGVLQRELGADHYVIEEGLNSRTTMYEVPGEPGRNGLEYLPIALETHAPLDAVVLALGINDVFLPGIGARWAARGVEALIGATRTSGAGPEGHAPAVLVLIPPPLGVMPAEWEADAPTARDESRRLPQEFRRVCDPLGVAMLDLSTVCEVSPHDGLHFDADAHAAIGSAVAAEVRSLLG
jgi:lysophospholipase L1-like esterase